MSSSSRGAEHSRLRRVLSAVSNRTIASQESVSVEQQLKIQALIDSCGEYKTESEIQLVRIISKNGGFSLHQLVIFIFTLWYCMIGVLDNHSWDYIIAVRCEVPGLEGYFSFDEVLNISVKNTTQRERKMEHCKYDLRNYTELVKNHNYDYNAITDAITKETADPEQIPCKKYVKKKSIPLLLGGKILDSHSLREEFELFCHKRSIFLSLREMKSFGMFLGGPLVGLAADIIGRKPIFAVASGLKLLGIGIFVFPSSQWILLVGEFVRASGDMSYAILYVLFLEKCNHTARLWLGFLLHVGDPLGTLFAFILRNSVVKWRHKELATISMFLVVPFGIWYMVESPRWLMCTGNKPAAWKALTEDGDFFSPNINDLNTPVSARPSIKKIFNYLSNPIYRRRVKLSILINLLSAFCINHRNTVNPASYRLQSWRRRFVSLGFLTFIPLTGYVLAIKVGRRKICFGLCLALTAIDIMLTFKTTYTANRVLAFCHMSVIEALINTNIFYATELFPTPCRITAIGIYMSSHGLGRILYRHIQRTFVDKTSTLYHMPSLLASVSCALLFQFLPITRNEGLPDTLREGLYIGNPIELSVELIKYS